MEIYILLGAIWGIVVGVVKGLFIVVWTVAAVFIIAGEIERNR